MKVIKRDGRAVDYNKEKIAIAIEKANQEVRMQERATKEEIKEIVKYIEELNKKIDEYRDSLFKELEVNIKEEVKEKVKEEKYTYKKYETAQYGNCYAYNMDDYYNTHDISKSPIEEQLCNGLWIKKSNHENSKKDTVNALLRLDDDTIEALGGVLLEYHVNFIID